MSKEGLATNSSVFRKEDLNYNRFLCEALRILRALCGSIYLNAEAAENTQRFAEQQVAFGCTDLHELVSSVARSLFS